MKKITVTVENTKEIEKDDQQYIINKIYEIKNKLGFPISINFKTVSKHP